MSKPNARLMDPTLGGKLIFLLPPWNVIIEGYPAARVADRCIHNRPIIAPAAYNVLFNDRQAARVGDKLLCGCMLIVGGAPRTLTGTCTVSADPELARLQKEAREEDRREEERREKERREKEGQREADQGKSGKNGKNGKSSKNAKNDPLADPKVKKGMNEAWTDSKASDPSQRHEEGGFIVKNKDGSYDVERWPSGQQSAVGIPNQAPDGTYNGREVVGTFHTHPNPGPGWDQGPSMQDAKVLTTIKGTDYIVSDQKVYSLDDKGLSKSVGSRGSVLGP